MQSVQSLQSESTPKRITLTKTKSKMAVTSFLSMMHTMERSDNVKTLNLLKVQQICFYLYCYIIPRNYLNDPRKLYGGRSEKVCCTLLLGS